MYLRYIKIHNMNLKSYLKILKLQNGDSNLLFLSTQKFINNIANKLFFEKHSLY